MSALDDLRTAAAQARDQRAALARDLGQATSDVDLRAATLRSVQASGDTGTLDSAQTALDDARRTRRGLLGRVGDAADAWLSVLASFTADPCDVEADVPLVLLPVRLETRYADGGATLKVRIFPDEVHLDRLDEGVSDLERAAAVQFWTAVWQGGPSAEAAAWQALRTTLHPNRAAWSAWTLTPTNLDQRPLAGAATPPPVFPDAPARTGSPPVARLMPDRFVVTVTQGASTVSVTGEPVPDGVVVSFPRDDDGTSLTQSSGGAVLGPGMEWFVDFDEATRVGLGVSVSLIAPGQPVDEVLAYGVRASLDPAASSGALEDLLVSHRFGAGLAVLRQGAPTNNTEQDRTDWTSAPTPAMPPTTTAARTLDPTADAGLVAGALGLTGDALAGVPGADLREQELAHAAQTALWGPSWATFLDRVTPSLPDTMFDDDHREALRDLFVDHVRGSGPFPALRIGSQPYGVLPVSLVANGWVARDDEPLGAAGADLLRRLRPLWLAGLTTTPRVQGDQALDDTLLEVLGSAPQLLGLRVRSVASASALTVLPGLLGLLDLDSEVQGLLDSILWEVIGLPAGPGIGGVLGKTTRPVGLPLVTDGDPGFFSGNATQVGSVLQALVALTRDQAQRAVDAASPPDVVPRVLDLSLTDLGDQASRVRSLSEDVLASRVQPSDVMDGVQRIAEVVGPAGPVLHSRIQPITALRNPLSTTTLSSPLNDELMRQGLLRALQAWLRASAHQQQVEDAVGVLGAASTSARGIAAAAALDCSSHRLDAWVTALVDRRLSELRASTPQGCQVGAFGWVEDVAPQDPGARPGGHVLSPSVQHAITAGVLRSAYLHHNPDATGNSAFAVDLSSARVRAGRALLDGVRNGQPLGALLGYRFERRLAESPHAINRFVPSLRALAPLAGGKLAFRVEAPPAAAAEAVAATDVIDGIQLIDAFHGGVDIRAALATKPANNPYLGDPWPAPTDEEWADIVAAIGELEQLADAVADLLMAEAVHQLVQGNTTGTAATLDAAAGGDALPVDPLVTRIPARGSAVTYRLLALCADAATGPADGWRRTPRSLAEPRLEAWARHLLGPATQVVCSVTGNGTRLMLDAANLSALDLVVDSLSPEVLRRRLETRIPALTGAVLAQHRDASWPPDTIALGELALLAASIGRSVAGAQPLVPETLTRAGDRASRQVAAADLADLVARVQAAVQGLTSAVDALEAVPPDAAALDLARAVDAVAAYGVPAPPASTPGTVSAVVAEARRRLDAATTALVAGTVAAAQSAAAAVFGDGFQVLPVVTAPPVDLFRARFGELDLRASALRRLVREVATVRIPTARYADSLLLGDALGRPRALAAVQLATLGAEGTDTWLGDGLAADAAAPTAPVTCLVAECSGTVTGDGPLAGLVLDEWVEVIPARTPPAAVGEDPRNLLTAGLAANVSAPDARPPQAILLAVSPDGQRWSSDRVAALLRETRELAKIRLVGLERVALAGRLLPALQEQSWSLQGEQTLDLSVLMTQLSLQSNMIAFVKE